MGKMKELAMEEQEIMFWKEMRSSVDYKIGFAKSSIQTAAWYIEHDMKEKALEELRKTIEVFNG